MYYINWKNKQQPAARQKKLIERYIRITERMDELIEELSCPGDYTVRQYDKLTSEHRDLAWQNLSLSRSIVTEFRTVYRLTLFRKRFYPNLNIKDLIPLFSGGFNITEDDF